jgi:hypothetical protein
VQKTLVQSNPEPKMSDPLYGFTATAGLHVLKSKWGQKTYLGQQSRHLADNLDEAIKETHIPKPRKNYFPDSHDSEETDLPESRWERAMWNRWKDGRTPAIREAWKWIPYYQVPLFSQRGGKHYRGIDLLGIDENGTLAVVELKTEPLKDNNGRFKASQSPLKMILEAAAYATVIEANWEEFQKDLARFLMKADKGIPCPKSPKPIRLVGVAPESYWNQWVPLSDNGVTVARDAWDGFRTLLNELAKRQLLVSFVSIRGSWERSAGLTGRHLKGFPLG